MASKLLDDIIGSQNRSTNLKVVFVDIVSYSQRRSITQANVVDAFMSILEEARAETAKHYHRYSEDTKTNFRDDVIFIPSGDGAAVAFSFEGLHEVHLNFAKNLLKAVHTHNSKQQCAKFEEQGWCNCHPSFNLTVGVSEGRGIVFRDINKQYNVAGTVMNLAARVMSLADRNTIIFTEDAYRQLIDVVNNPNLDENFLEFSDIRIKGNQKLKMYQYIEPGLEYLNINKPQKLDLMQKTNAMMTAMKSLGFPIADGGPENLDLDKMVKLADGMKGFFEGLENAKRSPIINQEVLPRK